MKRFISGIFIITLIFNIFSESAFAQVGTNIQNLEQIAVESELQWKQMQKRAEIYAQDHQLPLRQEFEDGTIIQLVDVVDGIPMYFKTHNLGAAITTRANQLWPGGNVGVTITGEGYDKIGIWDGGAVRTTHQEFNNEGASRVTKGDNATSLSSHATHVAGTIVAGGVNSNAKGMAYQGQLKAYDWNSAESEMTIAAMNGMEISNHSWGYIRGWNWTGSTWQWQGNANISPTEDYMFGFYNSSARSWDAISYNAPYFLMVVSAGNDRGDGPSNAGQDGNPEKDGGTDGFDCSADWSVSKNTLSVGNAREVLNYTGPGSVIINASSGWGPADDGRIKPDVVAKGTDVYSPTATNNTSYATYTGTSMSSPNTAGTLALLQQLYQQTHNGERMRASTLKGLTIHAADEAGPHPGPDYMFGWGLVNAERAANIILEDDVQQNSIDEITLTNGGTWNRDVTVSGGNPFWVTICWTDPPGNIPPPSLNPRNPVIKNDLDLKIVSEGGTTYYPYRLDPDNPSAPATTFTKNYVDNVEKVYIADPEPGTYTITVDHEGTLSGSQVFSIIISGIDEYTGVPQCSDELLTPANMDVEVFLNQLISWKPAPFATSYDVYFGTDGGGTSTPTNIHNGTNVAENSIVHHMQPLTTYYLKVIPRNNVGTNDNCNTIWSFTTMPAINSFPFLTDVENATIPQLPEHWQAIDNSSLKWTSTNLIGFNSSKSLSCYSTNGQNQSFNNWLISPPIAVEDGNEYFISFKYRSFLPSTPEKLSLRWGIAADPEQLTNVAFQNSSFNDANWLNGEALIVPGITGHIFLAMYLDNNNGLGAFVDNILVEDWGPVGIQSEEGLSFRVRYNNGVLSIDPNGLNISEIQLINTAGQTMYSAQSVGNNRHEAQLVLSQGVYVVQVKTGGKEKAIKLIVR
jgi:hypothetical protein